MRVLMSKDNPTGWKLEELLDAIVEDLTTKNDRLVFDEAPCSMQIRRNNAVVMNLLRDAEVIQKDTLRVLDTIGPDQGPNGTPRIGSGS